MRTSPFSQFSFFVWFLFGMTIIDGLKQAEKQREQSLIFRLLTSVLERCYLSAFSCIFLTILVTKLRGINLITKASNLF